MPDPLQTNFQQVLFRSILQWCNDSESNSLSKKNKVWIILMNKMNYWFYLFKLPVRKAIDASSNPRSIKNPGHKSDVITDN